MKIVNLGLINNWSDKVSEEKEKLGKEMFDDITENGPEFVLDAFRYVVEHMLNDKQVEELRENFFGGDGESGGAK